MGTGRDVSRNLIISLVQLVGNDGVSAATHGCHPGYMIPGGQISLRVGCKSRGWLTMCTEGVKVVILWRLIA